MSAPRTFPAVLATLAAAGALVLAGFAATAHGAAEGGPLTQACRGVSETLRGPCRGVEQIASAASANCRWAGLPDRPCTTPLGPDVSGAPGAWAHRALALQHVLANDVGLANAPWVGTHNSFNSVAEMGPTLSDTDSNQQITLADQLGLDIRSLELDVHWFPSLRAGGARRPVVCHALGNHGGCSIEKDLATVIAEVAAAVRGLDDDQVVLLYVEDHLDDKEGYDTAARTLKTGLDELLYRPPGGGCAPLPLDLTRDDILRSGARVIIVSDCGVGGAWRSAIFDWSSHVEERPHGYTEFPRCGTDFTRATYDSNLVRYYEDSTGLTAGAATVGQASTDDGITPATAAKMMRCGVDLTGMDQVVPDDPRFRALVWSWAQGEPGAGDCAVQRVDGTTPWGRWFAEDCVALHRPACRSDAGAWSVAPGLVGEDGAEAACASLGASHAVPRTGYEAQLLRLAMADAGAAEAWLGHRRVGDGWLALDPRG